MVLSRARAIDADVKIGVQVPFFGSFGDILLGAGVVIGIIGIIMLYFTIRQNNPKPFSATPR